MPAVLERLDAAGPAAGVDGAEVVFPPGFTNRDGEPLPLIVRSRAGALHVRHQRPGVRHRPRRAGQGRRALYVVGAPQAQHLAMVFAVVGDGRLAGAAHRGGARRRSAACSAPDRKMLKSRGGEPVRFIDVVDEAIERGRRGRRREEPGAPARAAGGDRSRRRHRRPQVRRPVHRSHPRLRLRLGSHAVVRRQHGAVPAVRPRPDLLAVPARRGRPGERAVDRADVSRPTRSGPWRCALLGYDTAVAETVERYSPHRLCTYLYELASDFTTFYEHCPVLQRRRRRPRAQPPGAQRPDRAGAGPRPRPARHRGTRADVAGRPARAPTRNVPTGTRWGRSSSRDAARAAGSGISGGAVGCGLHATCALRRRHAASPHGGRVRTPPCVLGWSAGTWSMPFSCAGWLGWIGWRWWAVGAPRRASDAVVPVRRRGRAAPRGRWGWRRRGAARQCTGRRATRRSTCPPRRHRSAPRRDG